MQNPFVFAAVLASLSLVANASNAASQVPDDLAVESDFVLTPTRLRQALADSPAAVTVITADAISRYNIQSVVDALRLVPGMQVAQADGNDVRVNYHGGNILVPRRLNIMIDGISAYRPGLARINWWSIPVAMSEIERIEVTRGPASAAYGPNSMTAVINVVTKTARATGAITELTVGTGTTDSNVMSLRFGRAPSDSLAYRVSAEQETGAGYDAYPGARQGHDSHRTNRGTVRLDYDFTGRDSVNVLLMGAQGTRQQELIDSYQQTYPDVQYRDLYAGASWRHTWSESHDSQMRVNFAHQEQTQNWTSCPPTALLLPELGALWRINPKLANALIARQTAQPSNAVELAALTAAARAITLLGARAGQATCGQTGGGLFENRFDAELQSTITVSPNLRAVIGAGHRYDYGSSESLSAGRLVGNSSSRLFGNAEYHPLPNITLNAGFYLDRDQWSGTSFSPRLGANWAITPEHTIRVGWATGTRRPDLQEHQGNWSYLMTGATPAVPGVAKPYFYQSAVAAGGLLPERNSRVEVGSYGNLMSRNLTADIVVFREQLRDLISEKLSISSFLPTNSGRSENTGVESEIRYTYSQALQFGIGGAYVHSEANNPLELTQYSSLSGFLTTSYDWGNGLRTSLVSTAANNRAVGGRSSSRQDFKIAYTPASLSRLTMQLGLAFINNDVTTVYRDVGKWDGSRYDRRLRWNAGIKLAL